MSNMFKIESFTKFNEQNHNQIKQKKSTDRILLKRQTFDEI